MEQLTHLRTENGIAYWKFTDVGQELFTPTPKEIRRQVETLIISDTHFGTTACRARALLALLNTFWIQDHFVLLGDIFQDLNFRRISGVQWQVISRIRKLTSPELSLRQVWIRGNHDEASLTVLSHLLGLEVLEEFKWEHSGKRFLATHGDQFDTVVQKFPFLVRMAIGFHALIRIVDPQHNHINDWLDGGYQHWLRKSKQVAKYALHHGNEQRVDYMICGHTHTAMRKRTGNIEYINSGCWVKDPCSFVTVVDGEPMLNIVELS